MPALAATTSLSNTTASNVTSHALQVICAWPVSGQYGPGSRWLYYILVAACVFARKAEWLRNACLAAALLFPAVAALHGIVLAAVHVEGAVDMDVYGAFQLCSIGILAAPVTVRISKTYFDAPGRNIIFLWTGLILSGLLSLTVEFFRIKPSSCTHDNDGKPIWFTRGNFTYSDTSMCSLICDPSDPASPTSPIRKDSQDNIYVIPAPHSLTFGTATLLAAACCVPAILYLIFMWIKILEINWRIQFGNRDAERLNEVIEGTNGATIGKMKGLDSLVGLFLSAVEVPLFSAAVLAILILGESNFFSQQLKYQSEPIGSVGQWAPIVGTGLAVLGSLYLLLAKDLETAVEEEKTGIPVDHVCTCTHDHSRRISSESSHSIAVRSNRTVRTPDLSDMGPSGNIKHSNDIVPTMSHRSWATDAGNRRKVARTLTKIGNYLGNAAPDRFDDSEFKSGKAVDFPEIPGEEGRNVALPRIREQFNTYDESATPALRHQRSRSGSFNSRLDVDAPSPTRSPSPRRSTLDAHSPTVRTPSPAPRRSTLQVQTSTYRTPSPRRNTLEVPSPVRHRHNPSESSIVARIDSPSSPTVVISPDPDDTSLPMFESPPTTPPLS